MEPSRNKPRWQSSPNFSVNSLYKFIRLWLLLLMFNSVENHNFNVLYNPCSHVDEVTGMTEYLACLGEPEELTRTAYYNLTLSSPNDTCGDPPEIFCGLRRGSACDYCNASDPARAHPQEYMVDADSENTWWQSVTWQRHPQPLHINITFSFGKLFELSDDIIIRFNSGRPQEMVLEKSIDFGRTWMPLQYYASSCQKYFNRGVPRTITMANPDAVICTEANSVVIPYTGGEVKFSVTEDRFKLFLGNTLTNYTTLFESFNETNWNVFLRLTDLRIRLLYPATDGNELFPTDNNIFRKYYYAIADVSVTGRCYCNLHAKFCQVQNGRTVCDCQHNTAGDNCEHCLPLYNDKPWRPGYYLPVDTGSPNQCQKCNCNDHADSCTYQGSVGGGVCDNCYHNTRGRYCHECQMGYYRNLSLPMTSVNACAACNCEVLGVRDGNLYCLQSASNNQVIGQCFCKDRVTSRRCDMCVDEYYGLLLSEQQGTCKACGCNQDGTVLQSNVCEKQQGQCPCKPNIHLRTCSECRDGFYDFPAGRSAEDCQDCACDPGGSRSLVCDKVTGFCQCRPNVVSKTCNTVAPGYFHPYTDAMYYKVSRGNCSEASDVVYVGRFTGMTFQSCLGNAYMEFGPLSLDSRISQNEMYVYPAVRFSYDNAIMNGVLDITVDGSTVGETCPTTRGALTSMGTVFTQGTGNAWVSISPVQLDKRCQYIFTLSLLGEPNSVITIDALLLLPALEYTDAFIQADIATQLQYRDCVQQIAKLNTKQQAVSRLLCQQMAFSVMAQLYNGTMACDCDSTGTVENSVCASYGGQCQCKPGVFGLRCDVCAPGYYNFSVNGCTACNCPVLGSESPVCDTITGQCPCRVGVARAGQLDNTGQVGQLQCTSCLSNYYGYSSGQGCTACLCDQEGSLSPQCDSVTGVCSCKVTITGDKCDRCLTGYYNFTALGCRPCNCNPDGSLDINCNQTTGLCPCKSNVDGAKCDSCVAGTFNLAQTNPDGCQPCFCFEHGTQCTSAQGYVASSLYTDSVQSWLLGTNEYSTHRRAPAELLGNRFTSYGQLLSLYMRPRTGTVFLNGERAVVMSGGGVTVFYDPGDVTLSTTHTTQVEVLLHEQYWRLAVDTRKSPSPRQFYGVLVDLQAVYIKSIYSGTLVDTLNVTLVTAEPASTIDGSAVPVSHVENCTCGSFTSGLSCETCQAGHRRIVNRSDPYSPCQPCECNGRTETVVPECDAATGVCLNCRNGTMGSDCSGCAANVIGANCDQCSFGFWGLGRDGCRACECSPVGANGDFCQLQSGQCDCKANVIGRQCDTCADNYGDLTSAGCTVCDECYSLVTPEVDLLRQLQVNLTQYVTYLQSQDWNTELGTPFTVRLNETLLRMDQLKDYLTQAAAVETPVSTEITRLNQTLQHLIGLLETVVNAGIQNANATNAASELLVEQSQVEIDYINTTLRDTYGKLQGSIAQVTADIGALLSSIQTAQSELSSLANNAVDELVRTTTVVEKMEVDVTETRTRAQETLQLLQTSQQTQQNSTDRANSLQVFMRVLASRNGNLATSAEGARSAITQAQEAMLLALGNVSQYQDIVMDSQTLTTRAQLLKEEAEALNFEANQATANNQTIVALVKEAELYTAGLTDRVVALRQQAENLLARARTAYNLTASGKALEGKTFTDAQRMLQIMREFDAQAAGVSAAANRSLLEVQKVKALSDQAIQNAEVLRSSLQPTQAFAQNARTTAEQARSTAQSQEQTVAPVRSKAMDLETHANSQLNNLPASFSRVGTANTSLVQPAVQVCQNLSPLLLNVQSRTSTSYQRAQLASQRANTTRTRLSSIQTSLNNIASLNLQQIASLKAEISQQRSELNAEELRQMVAVLLQASKEQRAWLEEAKVKRNQMRAQIEELKKFSEMIRTT